MICRRHPVHANVTEREVDIGRVRFDQQQGVVALGQHVFGKLDLDPMWVIFDTHGLT
jgi:hypothetical protein